MLLLLDCTFRALCRSVVHNVPTESSPNPPKKGKRQGGTRQQRECAVDCSRAWKKSISLPDTLASTGSLLIFTSRSNGWNIHLISNYRKTLLPSWLKHGLFFCSKYPQTRQLTQTSKRGWPRGRICNERIHFFLQASNSPRWMLWASLTVLFGSLSGPNKNRHISRGNV